MSFLSCNPSDTIQHSGLSEHFSAQKSACFHFPPIQLKNSGVAAGPAEPAPLTPLTMCQWNSLYRFALERQALRMARVARGRGKISSRSYSVKIADEHGMSSLKVYCVGASLRFPVKVLQHFYAHIIAIRSGHASNFAFARQLLNYITRENH